MPPLYLMSVWLSGMALYAVTPPTTFSRPTTSWMQLQVLQTVLQREHVGVRPDHGQGQFRGRGGVVALHGDLDEVDDPHVGGIGGDLHRPVPPAAVGHDQRQPVAADGVDLGLVDIDEGDVEPRIGEQEAERASKGAGAHDGDLHRTTPPWRLPVDWSAARVYPGAVQSSARSPACIH